MNISRSTDGNSSFGNIIATARANPAREEEEEEADDSIFVMERSQLNPLGRDPDLPEPKPPVLPIKSSSPVGNSPAPSHCSDEQGSPE